jgi:hypothetical protein
VELETRYKKWVVKQNNNTLNEKSQYWHNKIYKFHQDLTTSNIPHVFFNCMYDFFWVSNQQSWNHNHISPYNNHYSFYWYLTHQGFKTDNWYHHGAEANQCWADFLIKHIKDYDIIR